MNDKPLMQQYDFVGDWKRPLTFDLEWEQREVTIWLPPVDNEDDGACGELAAESLIEEADMLSAQQVWQELAQI